MATDDYYSENAPVCQIYSSEDAFTSFVQAMLALFALASLWMKRLQEKPRRKFLTWFLDVSKQAFGACYAHVLNMVISSVIAGNVRGEQTLDDECAWYAINYVIDTTLGLVITIVFLDWLERVANARDWASLKNSGVYVGKEGIVHWAHQMIAWIIILTLVKVVICVFMWITSAPLAWVGGILFEPLQSNIRFELLFVMIFFPGVLNIIYFWITDSYLKAGKHHSGAHDDHDETIPGSEMSPVKLGESVQDSVTPYSQMVTSGVDLNGRDGVASYGATPTSNALV